MSSCDEYSDNEPYSSDEDEGEYEYEIPLCFCGKDAKLRIAGTQKNYNRRFYNCAKRKFNKQCGFFVWEDELFSDESGDESSYICDDCLKKEEEIDEIESARDNSKASWDGEKKPSIDKVKDEPLDDYGHANCTPLIVKVKDEPLDQNGPADYTALIVKVKDEPLDHDGSADDTPLIDKVKDEPLDHGGPANDTIVKVKDEPLDHGGPANDAIVNIKDEPLGHCGPTNDATLIDKVKDEPLGQDGNRSCDKAELVCVKCLTQKRRVDEPLDRKKVEMLTKLESAESELCQIEKENNDADDKPLPKKLSAVVLGQISKKAKLANEVDHMPPLDKLSNSENETVESELDHIRKKTKLASEGCDVPQFEM